MLGFCHDGSKIATEGDGFWRLVVMALESRSASGLRFGLDMDLGLGLVLG